jgi:hypothetical protein
MSTQAERLGRSPSAKVKQQLDYPVIDTDVHTNDYSPDIEDYVASYGGTKLVDQLRKIGPGEGASAAET